jgi:hypothetical protein
VWVSKVIVLRFVTLSVDVGEWSDSSSGRFAAGEELQYQMIKRPGGSKNRYGRSNEENNPYLYRESNPHRPAHSHSTELVRDICRSISRHRSE